MVHALAQIRRVLHPGGVLADLRPDRFASLRQPRPQLPKIYWALEGRERFQGVLDKGPENLRKHRAATRTVKQVIQRGFFLLERTETFLFRYHFQTLGLFERFLRTAWKESFVRPPVYRRLQMVQRRSRTGHIVVIEPLRLNILRKR
jgi:hypothetical protein